MTFRFWSVPPRTSHDAGSTLHCTEHAFVNVGNHMPSALFSLAEALCSQHLAGFECIFKVPAALSSTDEVGFLQYSFLGK
jgi:hypothetical protein